MARSQRRLPKSNRLFVEALEDRALPSAAAPLDLAWLDGAGLFSDPVFSNDWLPDGSASGRTLHTAAANAAGAPTQATAPHIASRRHLPSP
jgi:hypothetical protein